MLALDHPSKVRLLPVMKKAYGAAMGFAIGERSDYRDVFPRITYLQDGSTGRSATTTTTCKTAARRTVQWKYKPWACLASICSVTLEEQALDASGPPAPR